MFEIIKWAFYISASVGSVVLFLGALAGAIWLIEILENFIIKRLKLTVFLIEFAVWKRKQKKWFACNILQVAICYEFISLLLLLLWLVMTNKE